MPTNRNFGLTFLVVLILIQVWVFFFYSFSNKLFIIFTLILFFTTYFFSKILYYPNRLWYLFGIGISKITSPIILSIIFLFLFVPISFFMRIVKRDILNLNFDPNDKASYWIKKKSLNSNIKNQY